MESKRTEGLKDKHQPHVLVKSIIVRKETVSRTGNTINPRASIWSEAAFRS